MDFMPGRPDARREHQQDSIPNGPLSLFAVTPIKFGIDLGDGNPHIGEGPNRQGKLHK